MGGGRSLRSLQNRAGRRLTVPRAAQYATLARLARLRLGGQGVSDAARVPSLSTPELPARSVRRKQTTAVAARVVVSRARVFAARVFAAHALAAHAIAALAIAAHAIAALALAALALAALALAALALAALALAAHVLAGCVFADRAIAARAHGAFPPAAHTCSGPAGTAARLV